MSRTRLLWAVAAVLAVVVVGMAYLDRGDEATFGELLTASDFLPRSVSPAIGISR